MEYPKRKLPRLAEYDYSQPGAYFITVCTKDKSPILCNIVMADASAGLSPTPVGADALIGPKCQLSTKGWTVRKYIESMSRTEGVRVDKYVIMPNHIHLLISIDNGPMRASAPTASIPGIMRSFKGLVTKELGENIFQRSYHDHIIRDEADYLVRWNYIDTNPAKWTEDTYYSAEK